MAGNALRPDALQAEDNPMRPSMTPTGEPDPNTTEGWVQMYRDWAERQRTMPPMGEWLRGAASEYGNALLMGTTAPGEAPSSKGGVMGRVMENPALAKWFGGSKVVDVHGAPLVVYHGSRADQPISAFDQKAAAGTGRWTADAGNDIGFHFTPDAEVAAGYGPHVGSYHLKMEKPLRINEADVAKAQTDWLNRLERSDDFEHQDLADFIRATKAFDNPGTGYYNYGLSLLADKARGAGHDGVIFTRTRDFSDERPIDEHIVFDPQNIRPAPAGQHAPNRGSEPTN